MQPKSFQIPRREKHREQPATTKKALDVPDPTRRKLVAETTVRRSLNLYSNGVSDSFAHILKDGVTEETQMVVEEQSKKEKNRFIYSWVSTDRLNEQHRLFRDINRGEHAGSI